VFYVYLLHSARDNGFYIGFSTDLKRRLSEHTRGASLATKSRGPWNLIYYEAYTEQEDAEGREKFLKSGAGRRLKLGRFPHSLAASLAALPCMSLIPFARFLRAQLRHYLRVIGFASHGSDHDNPTFD
jgi:putative endonuclease